MEPFQGTEFLIFQFPWVREARPPGFDVQPLRGRGDSAGRFKEDRAAIALRKPTSHRLRLRRFP